MGGLWAALGTCLGGFWCLGGVLDALGGSLDRFLEDLGRQIVGEGGGGGPGTLPPLDTRVLGLQYWDVAEFLKAQVLRHLANMLPGLLS